MALPDRDAVRLLLQRGVDALEESLFGGCLPAGATNGLGPQLNHELLEELRTATARLVDLDRRVGAPRVLRDAERHARSMAALLAQTPEHSRLRPRLLLATGETALLNASLAFDQDEAVVAERWARLATALAHLAGVPDLAAAAAALHARILVEQGEHRTALLVLRQLDVTRPSARGQAIAHVWEAIAHAAAGRSYESMAALDRADAELERSAGQPPTWWIPYTPATGIVCGQAISSLHLGKYERAYQAIEDARRIWPTTLYRATADMLTDLGRASLEIGGTQLAYEHAAEALRIIRATGSRRLLRRLTVLADRLDAAAVPEVPDLRAELGLIPQP